MIKIISIFFLIYYSIGTICLPLGDFSSLQHLPEMYRHCKTYEDKDMTLFDFITDHLLNIDGIFDKHTNGDEQKPHNPIQIQHHSQITVAQFINYTSLKVDNYFFEKQINFIRTDNLISSEYTFKILRPPIS